MNRTSRLAAFAAFVLAAPAVAASAAPAPSRVAIMSVADVRPGMKGVGRTVFSGLATEEFQVTIVGVLDNVGPRQTIVLASLEGGPLAKTGVIAGMSGSPVYIDGKLLGAVAYGFPFAKETIAGITPIAEMIEATRTASTARAASTRFPNPWRAAGGLRAPLDVEAFVSALRRPIPALTVPGVSAGALAPRLAGQALTPLSVPLVFSGFDQGTFEWARGIFAPMGFSPVMGGSGNGGVPGTLPDLTPGGPIAISLIEGDMDLSATGTITHIDGNRVYAFGHPFYNLGPTQFPMRKAYVYDVFPSLYQSWKISSAGEAVGTVEQDRNTAVAGTIGATPRMIPVEVNLRTSRGDVRTFSFRLVDDELFTPVLAFVSVASVLQGQERAFGTATISVDSRLSLAGRPDVRVTDMFAEEQPGLQAAALVAAPLAYLMSNDFEKVKVEKLQIDVTSQETTQSASIERAWVERDGPLRAGSTVPVKVLLRSYRGEAVTQTIPLDIPQSAAPGPYVLLVSDGPALTAVEQREMRQGFEPRDLDQLIRAINALRHNHHLYARLLRREEGAIVRGEYLQSLPPSALAVLGGADQGPTVVPLRTAAVWDFEQPTGYAVRGTRVLNLQIER